MAESEEFMSARVPSDLKRQVKAKAAAQGRSVADAIIEGMQAWVSGSAPTAAQAATKENARWARLLDLLMTDPEPENQGAWKMIRATLESYEREHKGKGRKRA